MHFIVQQHLLEDGIDETTPDDAQTKIETVLDQTGHEPALTTLIVSEINA